MAAKEAARVPGTEKRDVSLRNEEARGVLDDYAECLVKRRRNATEKALAHPADSDAQRGALLALVSDRCILNAEIMAPLDLLRGSLYRALVREDLGTQAVSFAESPITYPATTDGEDTDRVGREAMYLSFGSCAIRQAPETAGQIVNAAAAGDEEKRAIAQLSPLLGKCLVEDSRLVLTRAKLVGILSEAYYREARASQDASKS